MKTTATRISATGEERANTRADARKPAGTASVSKPAESLNAVGNLALQDLYARGALRAQLAVGAPNDAVEAAADRMANAAMSGKPADCTCAAGKPPCPRCQTAPQGMIRRKPRSQNVPVGSGNLSLGAERRLGDLERTFFESHYHADLSEVRVHDNAEAAATASRLNARAFSIGARVAFASGEFRPHTDAGKRLLGHELAHVARGHSSVRRQVALGAGADVQRTADGGGDPFADLAVADSGAVQSIVIDPGSRRTRFHTVGGKSYDGTVTTLASGFSPGDYLLARADPKDRIRTWNIFNNDGSVYRGGLQFEVLLEDVDFDSLGYTGKVKLKVATGLLPKLIDIEARIAALKAQVSKTLVNDAEEREILSLFEDIPPEQAAVFARRLREEKVDDVPLLERLDKDVDGENNIALHQHLSRLTLQAGGARTARALADAPELAWHDVMGFFEQTAVFSVTPSADGKYRIRYLGGISSGLFSKPEYAEVKKLTTKQRLDIMTGDGIEVDADQPIIVHDYDNDRQILLTAEDLIAYQHAGVRKFLQDVGTIASLATPAGGETVGARILAYGVQIATVATLIVDENKLNIREWFPNWGPAIIDASEKIKLAIAVIGIAQLIQGGWKLIANLRRLRTARAALDAKAVVASAEEAALAEKQAAQLEANADKLLGQADAARKELGLAEDLTGTGEAIEGTPTAKPPAPAGAVTASAAKTRVIESAIGKADFSGEFASLVNRELAEATHNPSRIRAARVSGYTVEVPIEGTDHFLARNAKGGWCLFSGVPKGCGAIGVEKTIDDLFAEIGRELGISQTARVGVNTAEEITVLQNVPRSPVDVAHAIGADYTRAGRPTGGHSLLNGDVKIVPGSESLPDAFGVYKATIQVPDPRNPGQWITKTSHGSVNSMFPKHWDAAQIQSEVDAAWNSVNKVINGDKWSSFTPSGVKVEGFISPRITVYPIYQP